MPGVKNSREEIDAGAQDALAEAISNLNAVDGASVAGLLDAYLDAAISSRSSHDWDPQGRIDAAVSTRSSHQWDPQGRIDAAITTRSSHDWDPNGTIGTNLDAKVSESGGTDWSSQTPESATVGSGQSVTINGSGYLVGIAHDGTTFSNENVKVEIDIDGNQVGVAGMSDANANSAAAVPLLLRFDSSVTVYERAGNNAVNIFYSLD